MPQTIKLGDSGPEVEELQQQLIEQGFDVGSDAADKIFGRDTKNAVILFQGGHTDKAGKPLVVDGIVGGGTWWALENPTAIVVDEEAGELAKQEAPTKIGGLIVEAAEAELALNVFESPNGSNRGKRIDVYTGWTGRPAGVAGPAWCAYYVSFVVGNAFEKAGRPRPFRIGNAQNIGHWAAKRGLVFDTTWQRPAPGDLGIIARDEHHGHIFIVRAADATKLWTIEGNASNRVRAMTRNISTVTRFVRFED